MTLRVIRAALTGFLLVAAGVLSFGALRHQAQAAEIIHGDLLFITAHTLAGVWALCPDVLAIVGIVGIRINRNDPRAWAALVLGLAMTLTFQVWADPHPWLLRGVPAAAGAMAVWILEVPWVRVPTPSADPQPVDVPVSASAPPSGPEHPQPDQPRTKVGTNGSAFTADQRQLIADRVAEGTAAKAIQRELGVSDRTYRDHLLPLVRSLKGDLVQAGVDR